MQPDIDIALQKRLAKNRKEWTQRRKEEEEEQDQLRDHEEKVIRCVGKEMDVVGMVIDVLFWCCQETDGQSSGYL